MTLFIPLVIVALIAYALIRRIDPYDAFVQGAAEALPNLAKILPNIAAILCAIVLFKGSGILHKLTDAITGPAERIGIPPEIVPLLLLRPLSGSGSLSMLSEILNEYGTDSFIGLCASVCVGSTETILYVIPLYCGTNGIKRTRYSFAAAIVSGIVGVFTGIILVRILF